METYKMKLRLLSVALLVVVIASGVIEADETAESTEAAKRADIKRMMQISGSGDMGVQVMNHMVELFRKEKSEVSDKFWAEFVSEVDADEIIEMCIPSYDRRFTHDEIKQLIAFYETPLGQKLIKTQPGITEELMILGQEWGLKLGERVLKRLEEEGY